MGPKFSKELQLFPVTFRISPHRSTSSAALDTSETDIMLLPLLLVAALGQEPAASPIASDPAVWVTEGQSVPSVALPRIDGSGVFELDSLRGKKVLLIQFASW